MNDPESGRTHVLAGGRRARARYRDLLISQNSRIESVFAQAGCDLVDLHTDQPVTDAMRRCLIAVDVVRS